MAEWLENDFTNLNEYLEKEVLGELNITGNDK